jgi:hypothetical protein
MAAVVSGPGTVAQFGGVGLQLEFWHWVQAPPAVQGV